MRQRSISHATFKAHPPVHSLKADEVRSQRRREMHAILEPHTQHRYAAFARRAAGGQRHWQVAILLRQRKLANFHHHIVHTKYP
jgi:hypothetical protein